MENNIENPINPLDENKQEVIDLAQRLEELQSQLADLTDGDILDVCKEPQEDKSKTEVFRGIEHFDVSQLASVEKILYLKKEFRAQLIEDLDDEASIKEALWELINALASIRVFLEFTNHLDDRSLYQLLVGEILEQQIVNAEQDTEWHEFFNLTDYPENDGQSYLQYYASDEEREASLLEFPDDPLPEKKSLLSDRDEILPQAY